MHNLPVEVQGDTTGGRTRGGTAHGVQRDVVIDVGNVATAHIIHSCLLQLGAGALSTDHTCSQSINQVSNCVLDR